jgi:multidrug efflux system outer membrane protein
MRYDVGAGDFLSVLDAERTQLELEDRYVQAATRRATALAALYKALAGDL